MKISVAGIGNAGTAIAAELKKQGHTVFLLKTSDKLHNEHYEYIKQTHTISVNDLKRDYHVQIDVVTDSMEEAIPKADLIILFVQTNYHERLIKRMAKYLHDGQTILIEPGYLSTCYILQNCKADLTIIEAESSPIDCRIVKPGTVKVLFKNVMNPFGVYPNKRRAVAARVLSELEIPFMLIDNVAEAALHNPNLIVHTIGAIFSIPRIEYSNGDYWMYKEVFTPHIWNVVESLDEEKMDILSKMGCKRLSYAEACKLRNSLDECKDAVEVFFDYANNSSPKGPEIPNSRYITEDVPQGLVLLESLGEFYNIKTSTTTGLINCACAALKKDFREEGRTVRALGEEYLKKILLDDRLEGRL